MCLLGCLWTELLLWHPHSCVGLRSLARMRGLAFMARIRLHKNHLGALCLRLESGSDVR